MPKVHLPVFAEGTTNINVHLAVEKKGNQISYFNGMMPVFTHDESDLNTFRMITSQFYVNGNATQAEICRAFGVPSIAVKRAVKLYQTSGSSGFYKARKTRGATILTAEVLNEAQELFDQGKELSEVAEILGIIINTLNKAVLDKRLHKPEKKRKKSRH